MAIPLTEFNRSVVKTPGEMTWSKKSLILTRRGFDKGSVPSHLVRFTENFSQAASSCNQQPEIRNLRGDARVLAFNSCISRRLGGGGQS